MIHYSLCLFVSLYMHLWHCLHYLRFAPLGLTECSHNDANLLQMIKINILAKISLSSFLSLRKQLVNNHKLYHYGEEIQGNFSDF